MRLQNTLFYILLASLSGQKLGTQAFAAKTKPSGASGDGAIIQSGEKGDKGYKGEKGDGALFQKKIQRKIDGFRWKDQSFSIAIGDVHSLELLWGMSPDRRMIPASITKLYTAAAVLRGFPPGTKFKTQLAIDAPEKVSDRGTLSGPLYFIGKGNPSFVSEDMWFLVNQFRREGVALIAGDIIVDDSFFDQVRFDDSRQRARVDRAYDAPVGALSFNWNALNVFVRPGEKAGSTAKVYLDPASSYAQLDNQVTTKKSGPTQVEVRRTKSSLAGETFVVKGSIAVGSPEKPIYTSISDPALWAGANLVSFLAQQGIRVQGKVRVGKAPRSVRVVSEHESKPVEMIVSDMNKFSNNFVAEMLTKQLGAGGADDQPGGDGALNGAGDGAPPGSIPLGMSKINADLLGLGIKKTDFDLVNPSGLTRENRVTARGLLRLLQVMYQDFRLMPEYLSSLPIAGVDGTLKRRLRNGNEGFRWIRAKTGLLTGVTSLAGYVGRSNGDVLSFVFIHNGDEDQSRVRQQFDDLAQEIGRDF